MSGNANTTISYPWEPNWKVLWGNGQFSNFQLDIVGFLAILGEDSVTANSQVSALSTLFYLPRLIPAPQALLWPARPSELPSTKATVSGVESGQRKEHVHHVAHVLLGDEMKTFTVRCVKVTKAKKDQEQTLIDRLFRGQKKAETTPKQPSHESEKSDKMSPPPPGPPTIKARANGPLAWVTLVSFFLAVIMLAMSILWGDGMSLIATVLLSSLSTLIGIVNKWNLKLPQRPATAGIPAQGHVVIRYPNGSFLVVICGEDVARELYFAPEEIKYNVTNAATGLYISLAGTLMLMGGVIALANAKLQLQIAWAGAYIITNAAHFIAAAVPKKMHWDLSCYNLEEQGVVGGPESETFTEALWKTIVFTKQTDWIKKDEAAPRTKVWDKWLEEAEEMANSVGWFEGKLVDPSPVWNNYGVMWDVPLGWKPKPEWDRINRESKLESQTEPQTEPQTPRSPTGRFHGER